MIGVIGTVINSWLGGGNAKYNIQFEKQFGIFK